MMKNSESKAKANQRNSSQLIPKSSLEVAEALNSVSAKKKKKEAEEPLFLLRL